MQPLLFDQGLPWQVAAALRAVDLEAYAVGDDGDVPPADSGDDVNIAWCAARGAVLITNDRGKKDKTIFNHLATHHVHAISSTMSFVRQTRTDYCARYSCRRTRWISLFSGRAG